MWKVRAAIFLLIISAVAARIYSLPYSNGDMDWFNLPWYQTLYQQGVFKALGTNFSNYSPPYTYLLAFATLSHDFIPPLTAIKLIPIFFDAMGAIVIYKIVLLKYPRGYTPLFAASLYFAGPTIILNSSYWGQVDSPYTFFLLVCIYYLLLDKPLPAMLAYGLSFSIKAQAVLLGPLLIILAFQKRIPWKHFLFIPCMYLLGILPVVVLGRPLRDALMVYVEQSRTYHKLSMNAANLWFIFLQDRYQLPALLGIFMAALLIVYWIYLTVKNGRTINNERLMLYAMLSVALTPFLLPKMHDRYFYPADVLSIVLAFYWPALWFLPILYQILSFISISNFLFHTNSEFIIFAVLLNAAAIAFLLKTQYQDAKNGAPTIPKSLLRLVSGVIPLFLFGLSLRVTPLPLSPIIPATHQQIGQIVDVQNKIKSLQEIWHASLVLLFLLGLLAWAMDWLPEYRLAAGKGGLLTLYLAPVLGVLVFACLNQAGSMPSVSLYDWPGPILFSVGFSALLGLFFRYHPAKRTVADE